MTEIKAKNQNAPTSNAQPGRCRRCACNCGQSDLNNYTNAMTTGQNGNRA